VNKHLTGLSDPSNRKVEITWQLGFSDDFGHPPGCSSFLDHLPENFPN